MDVCAYLERSPQDILRYCVHENRMLLLLELSPMLSSLKINERKSASAVAKRVSVTLKEHTVIQVFALHIM